MAKGAYKLENSERFLLSVDYAAVGSEHGITSHSAYCRFNGIKNKLKAELETEGGEDAKPASAPVTPAKRGGRKRASPGSAKAQNDKVDVDDEENIQTKTIDGKTIVERIAVLEAPESPTKRVKVKKVSVKKENGMKQGRGAESDESDHYYE
ncbi:hypothetical protein ABW21_db0204320 [Orbilia brochopaga]|nr:hypothetical protein ABW21_db0204320 [Drechslerella brochopaga]